MIPVQGSNISHSQRKNPELKQIYSLRSEVDKAVNQNKNIFSQLHFLDPTFTHDLYTPKMHVGENPFFLKALLLKQIDQLLDEKDQLLKKKEELEFSRREVLCKKEVEYSKNIGHYSLLRSVWTKFKLPESSSCEKIDSLNKVVGVIKNNIKILSEREGKFDEEESTYGQLSFKEIKSREKERQRVENIKMESEEIKMKYLELKRTDHEKNEKIKQLEHELSSIGCQIKKCLEALQKSSEKIKRLEQNKKMLEDKITQYQQDKECQANQLCFEGKQDHFIVKIQSSVFGEKNKIQQTSLSLHEVLTILRRKQNEVEKEKEIEELDFFVPELHLSAGYGKQKIRGETERIVISNPERFIPMRTQRVNLNKSGIKTTNGSEGQYSVDKNNPEKKFYRKGEVPLTTGRRRTKINFYKMEVEESKEESSIL